MQRHLMDCVRVAGGVAEHFETPGKIGPPDLIISWDGGIIHFAETKTTGGVLEPWQSRDHERRRKMGFYVFVPWTKLDVDCYIIEIELSGPAALKP